MALVDFSEKEEHAADMAAMAVNLAYETLGRPHINKVPELPATLVNRVWELVKAKLKQMRLVA